MKRAGPSTLAALEPLLVRLRALPGLVERTPGPNPPMSCL
jgi:hypothetical protein